ncbi:hypothetical protein [Shinella sp. BYT-45]|uniref:hypothetical protein n=1 Tax=Shinella sp. BYT-45 TaxID=3377377 RepID=UPI00397F0026
MRICMFVEVPSAAYRIDFAKETTLNGQRCKTLACSVWLFGTPRAGETAMCRASRKASKAVFQAFEDFLKATVQILKAT